MIPKFLARMAGWAVAGIIATMTFIAPLHAIEVAVPFSEGFVGVVGTNTQKANNITTFATMGITRMVFSQVSSGNTFELSLQGNDIPGTLRLYQGTTIIELPGSMVWRWPNQSPYSLGFIPSVSATISYGSGQTYAWLREPLSQRALEDQRQTKLIKTAWEESCEVYGDRKLHDDLCGLGEDISPNRAWRLARLAGIKAQIGYKKKPGSYGGNPAVVADNTLNREFDVDAPDQFCLSAIEGNRLSVTGHRYHLHPHP